MKKKFLQVDCWCNCFSVIISRACNSMLLFLITRHVLSFMLVLTILLLPSFNKKKVTLNECVSDWVCFSNKWMKGEIDIKTTRSLCFDLWLYCLFYVQAYLFSEIVMLLGLNYNLLSQNPEILFEELYNMLTFWQPIIHFKPKFSCAVASHFNLFLIRHFSQVSSS